MVQNQNNRQFEAGKLDPKMLGSLLLVAVVAVVLGFLGYSGKLSGSKSQKTFVLDKKINIAFARIVLSDVAKNLKIPAEDVQKSMADPAFMKKAEEYYQANKSEWPSAASFDSVKTEVATRVLAVKKTDDWMGFLKGEVEEVDVDETSEVLQRLGVQWDQTGVFETDKGVIPKLPDSPTIKDAVFGLSEEHPFYPKILIEKDAQYVIKRASIDTDSATK